MRILAIETSCDETAASVVEVQKSHQIKILSNVISSSLPLHAQTGGIIPERAARQQVKYIIPVIIEALVKSSKEEYGSYEEKFKHAQKIIKDEIDEIAVTIGPGLIGSLLVGVETAKTISYVFNKPLIPVNHLLGHIYSNFIQDTISFPFVALIVSGGHTDLVLFQSHKKYQWLGGTRDDAAGEALDKIGRLLSLSYPAGPEIEKRAKKINSSKFVFKSPLLNSGDFDFSFSGLKTEVLRTVKKLKNLDEQAINEICYSTQKAVIDVLVTKTLRAAQKFNIQTILLGGGVSANQTLRNEFELNAKRYQLNAHIFAPELKYCTDNAAMIGAYSAFHPSYTDWKNLQADPELYFDL